MTDGEFPLRAIIPQRSLPDIEIEVTREDLRRGVVHIECRACDGTGVFKGHPMYPELQPDCVECSTRGTIPVTV